MLARRQQGATLIELMVGVTVLAVLLAMGVPAFSAWMQDAQNRAAAESIVNGLQTARAEAVRRNSVVRFTLTGAEGQVGWTVGCPTVTTTCPADIQTRSAGESSKLVKVTVSADPIPVPAPAGYFTAQISDAGALPAEINFDGLGRVYTPPAGTLFNRADVTSTASASARRYVVVVSSGGQIRMCDPKMSYATDPRGCS
ncbi:GspH/FimT family pseudopilin [Pseudoduganella sp. R-34]|uniref:GspH/FimT family pseudopilin n=1 Tax=unclassified Pseudoduganella TaxID=2637179 RepID=UPI003CEAE781